MTEEERQALRDQLIADTVASGGITNVNSDGHSVTADPRLALELLDSVDTRPPNNRMGLRFVQLQPPGGGG